MSDRKTYFRQQELIQELPTHEREHFVKFLDLYYSQLIIMGALLKDVTWLELTSEGRLRILRTALTLWKSTPREI